MILCIEHIAEHSDNNNPERYLKTTGKQMQMPTRETPAQQSQTGRNTKSYKYQKNGTGPQPRNLEGGIQELLTTTMQAFELLRNNFERLVDLKMTQMDE